MTLTNEDLAAISELLQPIRDDIAELKADVAQLKEEMKEVKADIAELKADVEQLKVDVAQLKADVEQLKVDVEGLKDSVQRLESEVQKLKQRATIIELTLENETNRNINIIAEAHLNLTRKLDEALTVENEKEMLMIRVNILETELQKVKECLDKTA